MVLFGRFVLVYLLVQPFFIMAANANTKEGFEKLTFITEAYPPYNFVDHGVLIGIAVDLLNEATQAESIAFDPDEIKVYPWACFP